MPEHSHSPGPWRVKAVPGDPYYDQIVDADGKLIAYTADCSLQTEADARLMAAAPSLLEAGWQLSIWAAAIMWEEGETNTAEWLAGLKTRIERFQAIAEKLRR